MSWPRRMILAAAYAAAALMQSPTWAEDPPEPAVQPFVAQSLQQTAEYLRAVSSFRLTAYSLYDLVEESGIKIKMGVAQDIVVQRPNRIYARLQREDLTVRQLWYDGSTVAVMAEGDNTYVQEPVPDTIDAMLDYITDRYNLSFPLSDLIRNDIGGGLEQYLISGVYLGERVIDGVLCHHLSFESQAADFQLWVQAGDQPLPRRMVINFVALPGEPEYLASLQTWELNPQIDPAQFAFVPPAGAERTEPQRAQTE